MVCDAFVRAVCVWRWYGGLVPAGGPLRPGDVGVIERDDGSSKPFHVKASNGTMWWYVAEAVRLADGSSTGASTGEWRDQAVTKKYCSRAGDPEGAICEHGSDIIRESHWSCCGVLSRGSACTKVPCGAAW